jgi:glutaredoxin 3
MDSHSNGKPSITVYTTDPCARCIRAKDLLRLRHLEFVEVNLAKDPTGRRDLAECTGFMTFPVIVIDGRAIGGLRELQQADEEGLLESLAV